MKLSQDWIDHAAKEAEQEWFAKHPNAELIIGKENTMENTMENTHQCNCNHQCKCCSTVDTVKKLTQNWADQEKITFVEDAWKWDAQTDGSEHEQVCIYANRGKKTQSGSLTRTPLRGEACPLG